MLISRAFLWKKAFKLRGVDLKSQFNLFLTASSDLLAYLMGRRDNPISLMGGTYLVPTFRGNAVLSARPMTDDLYFIIPGREPNVERELKRLFSKARGFIDVGANVGYYTVAAALSGMEVLAFEPISSTASVLERNISLSGVSHKVKVIRAAAWSEDTHLTLNVNPYLLGQATARSDLSGNSWKEEKVKATTLDRFSSELPSPLIIKIDVEGSEVEVLRGAKETLNRTLALVIEISPGNLNPVRRLLEGFEFKELGGSYYLAER